MAQAGVFISYSSRDSEIALEIVAAVERAGIGCWIAPRDVTPGQDWSASIAPAIERSHTVVLLLSSAANTSDQIAREIHLAAAAQRYRVIPFRIEAVEPAGALRYLLSGLQWLDGTAALRDGALQRLIEELARREAALKAGQPVTPPAFDQEFGAQQEPAARRTNLPEQLTTIIGREQDASAVKSLLSENRLVTIAGPGGIGKTRLALDVAAGLVDGYPDGVWFVDLAPLRDPELVANEIASVLALRQSGDRPVLQTIVENLKRRTVLLLIDNCEHLIDEVARLAESILQQCAQVRVLATSREPLDINGEQVYRLPALAVPPQSSVTSLQGTLEYPSVALFVERAETANRSFALNAENVKIVAEICRHLDGIPFATELAAARVSALSVNEILERLSERLRILTAGRRTALPRQQTMRAMIDWSYDLLQDPERLLFRRLSAFAGGWTLAAAESVCAFGDLEKYDVVDCMASLVRKSLVAVDYDETETRYRMLESTRAYAIEKAQDESALLAERQADWVASFSQLAWHRMPITAHHVWLAKVAREIDNVRLALDWRLAEDRGIMAARIIADLGPFWYGAGLESEGRKWLYAVLDRVDARTDPALVGRLWTITAALNTPNRAVDAAQKAISLLEVTKDSRAQIDAYKFLAFALWQAGRLEEAGEVAARALALASVQEYAHTHLHAETLDLNGTISRGRGENEKARTLFDAALSIFRSLGDERGIASTSGNLAELEFSAGNTDRALELVAAAAVAFRELGALSKEAAALVNLATYQIDRVAINEARTAALEALALAQRSDYKPLIVVALQVLSAIRALSGDARNAAALIGYVDEWFRKEGYEREWSERRVHQIVINALRLEFSEAEIGDLAAEGSGFSEEQAISIGRGEAL